MKNLNTDLSHKHKKKGWALLMKIGNRFFDTKNHTYIMGILNVTPDSFSDGGKWNHMDEAFETYRGNDC